MQHAPADGYTLLMTPSTVTVLPAVSRQARYDATRDFVAITQVAGISNVLVVHPSVPAQTLRDLVALAKDKPGQLNYASAGAGSSPHMSMELLKHMAGIDLQHIPFKGTGPAMIEVLSGRIAALFSNLLTAKPLIEAGKLRALAVSGPEARGRHAGRADGRRGRRAGLFGAAMVRPAGACRHARRDRHQACVERSPRRCACPRCASGWRRTAPNRSATAQRISVLVKSELEKWAAIARAANIRAEE